MVRFCPCTTIGRLKSAGMRCLCSVWTSNGPVRRDWRTGPVSFLHIRLLGRHLIFLQKGVQANGNGNMCLFSVGISDYDNVFSVVNEFAGCQLMNEYNSEKK